MSKTAYKPNNRGPEEGDDNQDYFNGNEVAARPSGRSNRFDNDFDDQDSQFQMMSDRTGNSKRHNMPDQ